jgi:hypothetical protein
MDSSPRWHWGWIALLPIPLRGDGWVSTCTRKNHLLFSITYNHRHPPARTSFVPISLLAALGYLYSQLAIARRYPSLMEQVGTDGKPQPTIAGLALLLGIIPVILITTYLIMLLLPDPVFRIGDGTVRHDRVKSVRSKLGWMILAIIAAAILTRMARLFGTPW